jgi:hypothetical protein
MSKTDDRSNQEPGKEQRQGVGGEDDPSKDELERLPDNIGQSGRWRRKDAPSRYGHEEDKHSTEESSDDDASGVDEPKHPIE